MCTGLVIEITSGCHCARRRPSPPEPDVPARLPVGRVAILRHMERLHAVIGPLSTNVYVLADPPRREAIAIDTAIPCLTWIAGALAEREWTLKLIVSTHGHWDHMGDNAAVAAHTGAPIAVHAARRPPAHRPAAAVRAVRDPAVGAGGRAGGGRRDPVRRDPAARAPHAGPHGGLGLPAVGRRRTPVQRRHAVPERLGPGRLSPGSVDRRPRPRHLGCSRHGSRRRSAATPLLEMIRRDRRLPM